MWCCYFFLQDLSAPSTTALCWHDQQTGSYLGKTFVMARVRPVIQFFIHRNLTLLDDWTFIQKVQQSNEAFVIQYYNSPWRLQVWTDVKSGQFSLSLSSCFLVTLQPISTAGRELKNIQPNFVYPLNLKKKKRPPVCFCLKLAGIITQPHSLLVCLLSFFFPLCSSLLSHVWTQNKADSTARMKSGARRQWKWEGTVPYWPPDDG